MRLIVCGGRDFVDVPLLWRLLDGLNEEGEVEVVIEGASDDVTGPYKGADYWAHQWALSRQVPTIRVYADWQKHGRAAGPIRNKAMLDEHAPDWLLAFPGGRGTSNMIKQAQNAGIHVQVVVP
jgi:hypothetical protein